MKSMYVSLNSVDKVKNFVDDIDNIEGQVVLSDQRHIINAKSIMGIFSLHLSMPLKLEVENWKDEYSIVLKKYMVRLN